MPTCFIIQPFDNGVFDLRCREVFLPAIQDAQLDPYRVDEDPSVDVPIDDIERGIRGAAICLADITLDNPNVWYEVGFAFASNKLCCLVCSDERTTKYPFDIHHRNVIRYGIGAPSAFDTLRREITARLTSMLSRHAQVEQVAHRNPVTSTAGLSPHEITALCILMEHDLYQDGTVSGSELARSMEAVGYNGTGTSMAMNGLLLHSYATVKPKRHQNSYGDDGDEYRAYSITELGKAWLLANTGDVNLRRSSEASATKGRSRGAGELNPLNDLGDDIPF